MDKGDLLPFTAIVVAVADLLAQIGKDVPEVRHSYSPPTNLLFSGSSVVPEADKAEVRPAMGASGGIGPVGGTAAAAGRYNGHAMLPQ